jgi:hypothetical protein
MARETTGSLTPDDVVIEARAGITSADAEYARRKVASLDRLGRRPVRYAKVDLGIHGDAARERPAFAKGELDLDGQVVRAHATGTSAVEAIDLLDARLRERIERTLHRAEALHLRHRNGESWHHGDPSAPRPDYFPRSADERELVRRKSFAVAAQSPEAAAVALEQLDHDFYLFRNVDTGEDNVLHRLGGDHYELLQPSAAARPDLAGSGIDPSDVPATVRTVEGAIELLDLGDEPFVFFLDDATGRGRVVYRRFDGHYGLIVPADEDRG